MSKAVSGYPYYTSTAWKRLLQAIPATYTVWPDTSATPTNYRAECNLSTGNDISDTDAATVIAQACNAMTDGGIVQLNGKVFECSTALILNANSNIALCSDHGAILRASGISAVGTAMISVEGSVDNVALHGLTIDGDSYFYADVNISNGATNVLVDECSLVGGYDRNLWVWDGGVATPNNVTIQNCYIGPREPIAGRPGLSLVDPIIDISQIDGLIFENNVIEGDLAPGAGTSYPALLIWSDTGDTNRVTVNNNTFRNHHNDFIRIVGTKNAHIYANQLYKTIGSGIILQDVASTRVTIDHNIIEYANNVGIWDSIASDNLVINANTVYDTNRLGSTYPAIALSGSTKSKISDNKIKTAHHGIYLEGACQNCLVSANQMDSIDAYGIFLYNDPSYISIVSNQINDAGDTGIALIDNVNYCFFGLNHIRSATGVGLDHTTNPCDWNRFIANYVLAFTESAGALGNNTYVDNYPDDAP